MIGHGVFANGGGSSSDLQMGIAGDDGEQAEASFSFGAAYFPYEEGWLGAWTDEADIVGATFIGSTPGLPTSVVTWEGTGDQGQARVVLEDGLGPATGMLFVAPSDSSSTTKIAAAAPRDGGWDVTIRQDNNTDTSGLTLSDTGSSEFQFVYVPYGARHLVAAHIDGSDGTAIDGSSGGYSLTRTGAGTYAVSIDDGGGKKGEADGMLVLSVASQMAGTTDLADRTFLSYEYDSASGDFLIESRELTATGSTPTTDQFGNVVPTRDSNFYFAWVDFADPLSVAADPDFDGVDGPTNDDINALSTEIRAGTNNTDFNMNANVDRLIDDTDHGIWFQEAGFEQPDFDLSGDVRASTDGAVLLTGLGAAGGSLGHEQGDANGDGLVNASIDGALLLSALTGDTAAVPEPASLLLLGLALLASGGLAARGRRT